MSIRILEQQDLVPRRLGRYRSFPVMAPAGDGTIVVVYRDATAAPDKYSHGADGDSVIIRFDGQAWSSPRVIYSHDGPFEEMGCEISALADGRLMLWSRQWDGHRGRTHATCLAESTDGAETFSSRRTIELPEFSDTDWVAYGKMLERPGGDILQGAYGREQGREGHSVACLVSCDGGRRWRVRSWIARPMASMPRGFSEPVLFPLPDGSLYALLRTNGVFYETRSSDGGATWAEPAAAFEGMAGAGRVLSDGRLLVSYRGIHEKPGDERPPAVAPCVGRLYCRRISDDGGATWGSEGVIDDGTAVQAGSYGMGDLLELPDGRVKVIYYTSDSNQAPWLRECLLVT